MPIPLNPAPTTATRIPSTSLIGPGARGERWWADRPPPPTIGAMEERIVYVSRLTRLPLLGADGSEIGRINDAVIDLGSKPPRVNGFVVAMQRRRVFVGIGRIGEIGVDGARLRRGSGDLRPFA